MKIQYKFMSGMLFFTALMSLFLSLYFFAMALDYSGAENQSLFVNWRETTFLIASLTFSFGMGWSLQYFAEHLALKNHRNMSLFIHLIPFIALFLVSQIKTPERFQTSALFASVFIVLCGQLIRLSVAFTHPDDTLDKLMKAIGLGSFFDSR
jgi:hypothetical protein